MSRFVLSRRTTGLLIALLLALYWGLAVSTSPRMGVTADEVVHLTGGYSYWTLNDYRLQPENGTLPMRLAALPLLAMDLRFPPTDTEAWKHSHVGIIGREFFYENGNPLDLMLMAGRAAMALLGVFTVWLTWRWARGLYGPAAGWIALTLAVLCPALLAHGALITSDMAITAALLAVVSAFWLVLHKMTWGRLAAAVLASGAVLLAKMSGVLAAVMLVSLLVVRWTRPAPLVIRLGGRTHWLRHRGSIIGATTGIAVVTAALALVILWGGYGFRYDGLRVNRMEGDRYYFSWDQILDKEALDNSPPGEARGRLDIPYQAPSPTGMTELIGLMRDHRLLPEAYLWGFAHSYKFSRVRPAFLNGDYRRNGWPQFFPLTFWWKTPIPALLLFAAGVLTLAWPRALPSARPNRRWYRAAPLLVLFLIYWIVAIRTNLNIGHRHILPTYPVVYVFAGATALWLTHRNRRLIGAALALALAAMAVDSFASRPHYLSYFNAFAGGSANGWRRLVDSSFDWGQGLPDLGRWLQVQQADPHREPVYLTYFGSDSPRARQLPVTRFGDDLNDYGVRLYPVRPTGGWFVIGATHFQGVYLGLARKWDDFHEASYRNAIAALEAGTANGIPDDPEARRLVVRDARDVEMLSYGRLRHFLRNRQPDTIIGGSLLAFHLTDAEVRQALHGPLDEP